MSFIWTADEISRAKKLRAQGMHYYEMAPQLPGRTEKSIRAFFGKRGWGKQIDGPRNGMGPVVSASRTIVPDYLISERDRRANEYRTPAQILLGDPAPTQSALGRPCP